MGQHTAGWGGWRSRYLLSSKSLHSCFPLFPAEQHPGGKGRLKPPHVSCQLYQKQVGEAGLLPLQSREQVSLPASAFAGAPDPPKGALTPFSLPTPPDWPCSTGMDMWWITSASLSLTTSSRASSTSTPLAKCPRPCSETALVSRLPTAPHHSFLSLSPCLHLSPHPMAPARVCLSPPAPTLCCAAMSREQFSFSGALPCSACLGGRRGGDAPCAPSMSLGNALPSPSSQRAQSRGCLFCIILHNLSSMNLGGFFFFIK